MAWVWVDEAVVLAIHDEQLAEHGGASAVRDLTLLQSALARPRHLEAYGAPDAAALAAAYAYGIARNHPFVDGNKRTALVVAELFLALNGYELAADDAACVTAFLALAAGTLDEGALAAWFAAGIKNENGPESPPARPKS
ncbi:type II toxin-antitoxin system death-on-curing family toxin [Azospirillum sp. sgz301742]